MWISKHVVSTVPYHNSLQMIQIRISIGIILITTITNWNSISNLNFTRIKDIIKSCFSPSCVKFFQETPLSKQLKGCLVDLVQDNDPTLAFSSAMCLGKVCIAEPVAKKHLLKVLKSDVHSSKEKGQVDQPIKWRISIQFFDFQSSLINSIVRSSAFTQFYLLSWIPITFIHSCRFLSDLPHSYYRLSIPVTSHQLSFIHLSSFIHPSFI